MNNCLPVKSNLFLYRFANQNKRIFKNHYCKQDETIDIDIDINFKEKLKQHFKTLALINQNKREKYS